MHLGLLFEYHDLRSLAFSEGISSRIALNLSKEVGDYSHAK
jgi:hypothetical protein